MTRRTWFALLIAWLPSWSWWQRGVFQQQAPSVPRPCSDGDGRWPEYRRRWARVQCTVCAQYGFRVIMPDGCEEEFESVKLNRNGRMDYAHRPSCVALGMRFKHLQYHKDYKRKI